MLKKIVDIAHDSLISENSLEKIAVDFTCGAGFDTKFLCENTKYVYSYDIQIEALLEAKTLCKEYRNVEFHHKSHLYFDEDVDCFDIGIFNLGYYPKGDKTITTIPSVVIETLNKALNHLNHNGKILVVCYPGFESGKDEAIKIENFCSQISSKNFDIYKFQLVNRKSAPYIIGIEKH